MGALSKFEESKIKDIDQSVKNKFSFKWLERTVDIKLAGEAVTVYLGDDFVKCDLPGQALCNLCCKQINYGSRGVIALEDHVRSSKHMSLLTQKRSNYKTDSFIRQHSDEPEKVKVDLAASRSDPSTSATLTSAPHLVAMCDRISNAEALLLGTMSEYSMPFTHAPVIVELAKALAEDTKALSQLSMDQSTASYKTTYGLADSFKERLVQNLRQSPFSMNIDESTSSNDKRVLAVLVSFYDKQSDSVVCEHWESVSVIKVDALSIYNVIVELIESNEIPWSNLVSILMDSCSVMRGKKSGVETRIRSEKAPHLLDIDGDSCHHIHNACKKFCSPFDKYLEGLFTDIQNDFKWCTDQKDLFSKICELLAITYTTPERFLEHRWLSAYDVAVSTEILFDAFIVCYFSFLNKEDRVLYQHKVLEVCKRRKVSNEARARLREIRVELSSKSMTDLGKKRKMRITEKLFKTEMTTLLHLSFYQEVLPILKAYVLTFQSADTMVHLLHERQLETFQKILACFVKAEYVANKTGKQLKELDLSKDEGQFMGISDMFVGSRIKKLRKEVPKDDCVIEKFLNQASAAYIECAQHMQKTIPLNSQTLKSLSCIDPCIRNHSVAVKGLTRLTEYFSHLLSAEEEGSVLKEITCYSIDSHLPEETDDIVHWWTKIIQSNKYQALCKIAVGALSIFHGPRVESSFNVMGDVIGVKSGRMNVETYSAIQTVKYALKARKTSALKMFRRKDPRFSPVDRHICIKLRSAASRYKQRQNALRVKRLERLQQYSVTQKSESKTVMKKNLLKTQEQSYDRHLKLEAKRAKKPVLTEKLNQLCAKKKV